MIRGLRAFDGKVILMLEHLEKPEVHPENVIEETSTSPEERIALKLSQAMVKAFMTAGMPGIPQAQLVQFQLELTDDEYRQIGSPTLYQTVVLKFNIEVEEEKP